MDSRGQGPNIGRGVLQAIFAVFLGLMITAVVGVGVYTFYPSPADQSQEQIDELYEQRAAIEGCASPTPEKCLTWEQLSAADRSRITAIDAQIDDLQQEAQAQRQEWSQRTSVILIVIATGLTVISLTLGESLAVLSNGILLGGLFTMLYGVGWGLASGNSITRFLVLLAALAVSLGLGYLKFVRSRRDAGGPDEVSPGPAPSRLGPEGPALVAASGGSPAELASLAARVEDLERRLAAASAGLAGGPAGRAGRGGAAHGDTPVGGEGATRGEGATGRAGSPGQ